MDRRTFALTLSGMGLGLVGCSDAHPLAAAPKAGGAAAPSTPPTPPAVTPRAFDTAAERAVGAATGLVRAAEAAQGGLRWRKTEDGRTVYRTDLYSGHAGVLVFLAEVHRFAPDDELRGALEGGARWLEQQPAEGSQGLFTGAAGRGWAFLAVHEALREPQGERTSPWLAAALKVATTVAAAPRGAVSDLIDGPPGQGLFLLRLHAVTGDQRWLDAARRMGDAMLAQAVRVGDGIKFPNAMLQGRPMFYVGMAHGTAGAAYFLARLARALPEADRARYLDGARAAAAWLDALARPAGAGPDTGPDTGLNWYRREPDQMDVQQVQWCHGAPGIGLFYAELYRATRDPAHLATAKKAAAVTESGSARMQLACQCHGLAGNADLFLKLFRETGDTGWLERAERFADSVWARRYRDTEYPAWPSGDGYNTNNPGLMTGTSGVGWLFLQLARGGLLPGAVTG